MQSHDVHNLWRGFLLALHERNIGSPFFVVRAMTDSSSIDWLIDWNHIAESIDWLIDRPIFNWLIDRSTHCSIGWLVDSLVGWLIHWLVGWLIDWLVSSFFILQSHRVYILGQEAVESQEEANLSVGHADWSAGGNRPGMHFFSSHAFRFKEWWFSM